MKQAISIILAFLIAISVVYTIPNHKEYDVKYIAQVLSRLGQKEIPSLTGGYSFDGVVDSAKATAHIVAYPLMFVMYLISQIVDLFDFLVGIQDPFIYAEVV